MSRRAAGSHGRGRGSWGFASIGFGVRAGFDHAQLRDRDGGAPLFSEGEMRAQGISSGLLFVESDATFNLTFDPSGGRARAIAAERGTRSTRSGCASAGSRPRSSRGSRRWGAGGEGAHAAVVPYAAERSAAGIEGESMWPPRRAGGWGVRAAGVRGRDVREGGEAAPRVSLGERRRSSASVPRVGSRRRWCAGAVWRWRCSRGAGAVGDREGRGESVERRRCGVETEGCDRRAERADHVCERGDGADAGRGARRVEIVIEPRRSARGSGDAGRGARSRGDPQPATARDGRVARIAEDRGARLAVDRIVRLTAGD